MVDNVQRFGYMVREANPGNRVLPEVFRQGSSTPLPKLVPSELKVPIV